MKNILTIIFIFLISYSFSQNQQLQKERQMYYNLISVGDISKLKKEIKDLKNQIFDLEKDTATNKIQVKKLTKILNAKTARINIIQYELDVTKDYVLFLEKENDSIKLSNKQLISHIDSLNTELNKGEIIPKKARIRVCNKYYDYNEKIIEINFNNNNKPVVNNSQKKCLLSIIKFASKNEDIDIEIVGNIRKIDKKKGDIGDKTNWNYTETYDFASIFEDLLIKEYNVKDYIIKKTLNKRMPEQKVIIQLSNRSWLY